MRIGRKPRTLAGVAAGLAVRLAIGAFLGCGPPGDSQPDASASVTGAPDAQRDDAGNDSAADQDAGGDDAANDSAAGPDAGTDAGDDDASDAGCPSGETPSNGMCCPPGETPCGGTCVNETTDSQNCGYCGGVCPNGEACQSGVCCAVGWTWCSDLGECINELTDTTNCGGCGTQCQPAAPACQAASCICLTGTVCNGICVNELADTTNCGSCGVQCPPSAPTCNKGSCACLTGTMCGGVCVDESTDSSNCGGCGMPCGVATPFCYQGACTSTPPSCAGGGPGMTDCGASAESCCASSEVTGGTFYRTYNSTYFEADAGVYVPDLAQDGGPSDLADPATVSTFSLDKYLVTVGRFRQFVKAWAGGAGWLPPPGSGKHAYLNGGKGLVDVGTPGAYEPGWDPAYDVNIALTDTSLTSCMWPYTWTSTPGENERLPMDCVDWYEAYAFCIWDGGFLPSQAEWDYAAAGGDEQREYPWGSESPGTANQYAIYGCNYPTGSPNCTGLANIAPPGTATLGAGRWGQFDLVGELGAWDVDGFTPFVTPCIDCGDFTFTSSVFEFCQGGYFSDSSKEFLYPATGTLNYPAYRGYIVGIRCARAP
jgi:formylglycine-generating enzyme required for sulfatase activity